MIRLTLVLTILASQLTACDDEEGRRVKAINELSQHCKIPADALIYSYKTYNDRERKYGRVINREDKVIYLGNGVSDRRITEKADCIKMFESKFGYRFTFTQISPTALPFN